VNFGNNFNVDDVCSYAVLLAGADPGFDEGGFG